MQQQFIPNENTASADTSYYASPQEFARAAAEVETQPLTKEALKHLSSSGEQRPRTTLTDGEGHVFTIEGTVEQLLTEMQAHRTVKHQGVAMTRRIRKELSWWLLLGGFIASSAAAVGVTFLLFVFARNYSELQTLYIQQEKKLSAAGTLPASATTNLPALLPGQMLLSQVGDGTPVYARYADLAGLAQHKLSPGQIRVMSVAETNIVGTPQWMLLKSGGHYFVRGWRYTGEGGYKDYKDWFASIATIPSLQKVSQVPIERFQKLPESPETVQDADGTGEEVLLPDTP